MCIQFAGFWICACWKTAKSAKINVPRIFPRLQYCRGMIVCPHYLSSGDDLCPLYPTSSTQPTIITIKQNSVQLMSRCKYLAAPSKLGIYTWHHWLITRSHNTSTALIFIQWNLVITRSLGPWKLPCYIRFLIISGLKNNEIYIELGPAELPCYKRVLLYPTSL